MGLRFSRRAEDDLFDIGVHTLRNWGEKQADRYLTELEECCGRLANEPALGRACDHICRGLRRMECGSHVVFYRLEKKGILISRILHQRMLPNLHSIDED